MKKRRLSPRKSVGPVKFHNTDRAQSQSECSTMHHEGEYSLTAPLGKAMADNTELLFSKKREAERFERKLASLTLSNAEYRAFIREMTPRHPTEAEKQRLSEMMGSRDRTEAEMRKFLIRRQLAKNARRPA